MATRIGDMLDGKHRLPFAIGHELRSPPARAHAATELLSAWNTSGNVTRRISSTGHV